MTSHVSPSERGMRAFKEVSRSGPIQMLNLIRLADTVPGSDGHPQSGAQAYHTYEQKVGPVLQAYGGKVIWRGQPEAMLIGPDEGEEWDMAFIVEYPDAQSFVAMISDPDYQRAATHRSAAVENSRLIRMAPL